MTIASPSTSTRVNSEIVRSKALDSDSEPIPLLPDAALVGGVGGSAVHTGVERLPLGEAARGELAAVGVASECRGVHGTIHEGVELCFAAPDEARFAAAQAAGEAIGTERAEAEHGGLAIRQA